LAATKVPKCLVSLSVIITGCIDVVVFSIDIECCFTLFAACGREGERAQRCSGE
jgi:hypothetical protein